MNRPLLRQLRDLLPRTRDDWECVAWAALFVVGPALALAWIFARWPVSVL